MRNKYYIGVSIFIFIGMIFIISWPSHGDYYENINYLMLIASYYLVGGLYILLIPKKKIDIFEPITMVTIVLMLLMTISPIIFMINNNTLCYGTYVMDGSSKATLIYIISYYMFVFGYYQKNINTNMKSIKSKNIYSSKTKNKILNSCIFLWIILFIISLYYFLSCGQSIKYVLTLGLFGDATGSTYESSNKFLIDFSYALIPCWLYIYSLSKNKALKVITLILTLAVYISNGYRTIILTLCMSIVMLNYISKGKRPSWKVIFSGVLVSFTIFTLIGFSRVAIRNGADFSLQDFSLNDFNKTLYTNFNLYQPFYGIVNKVPNLMDYGLGRSMIVETITKFIPRKLWPNKPSSSIVIDAIILGGGESALYSHGMSWVCFGEYYLEFGYIGCFVIFYILGKILSLGKRNYLKNDNISTLITYCLLYSSIYKILSRGYMPNNFTYLVFLIMPSIIIQKMGDIKTEK